MLLPMSHLYSETYLSFIYITFKRLVEVIWVFKGVFMFVVTDSTSASLTAETLYKQPS